MVCIKMYDNIPKTLSFLAGIRCYNKIWCSNLNFNGLFTIDEVSGKIEYIGRFPNHRENAVGLHNIVMFYDNKLFFFSNYSETIDVYDMSGEFYSCDIEAWKEIKKNTLATCVAGAHLWKETLYIFPRSLGKDVILYSPEMNIIIGKIELKLANAVRGDKYSILPGYNTIKVGNFVYIPIFKSNKVIRFDLASASEELIEFDSNMIFAGAVNYDGHSIWAAVNDGIVEFDNDFQEILEFHSCRIAGTESNITTIAFARNKVIALPARFGDIIIIDKQNKVVTNLKVDMSDMELMSGPVSKWRNTGDIIVNDNYVFINPINMNKMMVMDLINTNICNWDVSVPSISFPHKKYEKTVNYEVSADELEKYLYYILNKENGG